MKRVPKESGAMKNILISAFLELMRQKKYTEITVTDIVKCAGVSRMAYYRAFSSKEDILTEYLKRLIAELQEKIENSSCSERTSVFRLVFCMIADHREFFRNMSGVNLQDFIVSDIVKNAYSIAQNFYQCHPYDKRTEYAFYYHIGGLTNATRMWIESGMHETVDEMSELISLFSEGGRAVTLTAG